MKYSEFKLKLNSLFEEYEISNECVIEGINYNVHFETLNSGAKEVTKRDFEIKIQ